MLNGGRTPDVRAFAGNFPPGFGFAVIWSTFPVLDTTMYTRTVFFMYRFMQLRYNRCHESLFCSSLEGNWSHLGMQVPPKP